MSEAVSLRQMVTETIHEYLNQYGGGIPDGFIYAIRYVNDEGGIVNEFGCMEEQSTLLSAGLAKYMKAIVDAWVNEELFCDEEVD